MGAKLITKVYMPQLKKLMFCTNKFNLEMCSISNEGAKHLNKGYWPHL